MDRKILPAYCLLGIALAATASVASAGGAAAAGVSTPTAPSAAAAESGATKGEIKAMREFKLLDFNGDGKLSRTEVKLFPRLSAAFDDADTDGDGYVSYEEVRVFAAKYRAERDRQKAAKAGLAGSAEPRP